jgi:FlaA1/EpsC-like NDP-sugar epimerase
MNMPGRFFKSTKGYVVFVHDIVMAAVSFLLSVYLRVGDVLDHYSDVQIWGGAFLFTLIAAGVFWSMRMYRGIWRYASLNDLLTITRAVTLAIVLFLIVAFLVTRLEDFPRSLPFINWFVLMALLGGPRFFYRLLKDRHFEWHLEHKGMRRVPVLLAGAGDSAEMFIRATSRSDDASYRVVGIVAEKKPRVGRNIHDVPILGTLDDIPDVVEALEKRGSRPQRLILTKDRMEGDKVRAMLKHADELGMVLSRLPKLSDFKSGAEEKLEISPVAVEDLLGRPQAILDRQAMAHLIKGRRVLITGAGGSIGSELVRQISDLEPQHMILLDSSEYALYSIDIELGERHPSLARRAVIADVRNRRRLDEVFAEETPELVFHAAALKHVPLVEDNIIEGALTNVVGTVNVAASCVVAGVSTMVLISTDKAVNPTSIMGATKRIAEQYCQSLDSLEEVATNFVAVRFGNVLGSTGSVVPLFQRQLAQGGPLTVTHRDMKRYFMTTREAVELVLEASAFGSTENPGDARLFVLDMGEPVLIMDLAKQVIQLAGLKPFEDIDIEITGLRSGEKLFEEVLHATENLLPTPYKEILMAVPGHVDADAIAAAIEDLARACADGDGQRCVQIIKEQVPELNGDMPAQKTTSSA